MSDTKEKQSYRFMKEAPTLGGGEVKHRGGRGRKAPAKFARVTVTLPPAHLAKLDHLARAAGVPRSEMVARLIDLAGPDLPDPQTLRPASPMPDLTRLNLSPTARGLLLDLQAGATLSRDGERWKLTQPGGEGQTVRGDTVDKLRFAGLLRQ